MSAEYLIGAVLSVLLTGYLVYALLTPGAVLRDHDRQRLAPDPRLLRGRDPRGHEAARRLHVPRVRGRPAAARRASSARSSALLLRLCGRRPEAGADLDGVRGRAARLQRLRRARHLRDPAPAARAAAQPAGPRPRSSRRSPSTPRSASPPTPTGRRYGGESTMSYLTQMAGLAWHNFTSAAAGIGVALALARGLTRRPGPDGGRGRSATSGSTSSARIVYVLLPLCDRRRAGARRAGRDPEPRALPRGDDARGREADDRAWGRSPRRRRSSSSAPTAAASSTPTARIPFENPTPLTNFLEMLADLRDPGGAHLHLRPDGARPAGRAGRSSPRWRCCSSPASRVAYWAEARGNPALAGPRASTQALGNMEGKEVRFGVANSALCARPSPPTPRAARSTPCTTASRRSAAWCRWSTSSSARSSSAASAPASTACWSSSCSRSSSPA